MTVVDEKAAIRKAALARRAEAHAARPDAGELLVAHAPPIHARCVAAYRPFRSEIDPLPLARAIVARGASLALPVIAEGAMHFRAYSEGDTLVRGVLGIEQPTGPAVEPDCLLVPLLAFTRAGGRIGYGAGYYDRYIAGHPGVRTIGVAFAAQELQELPLETHDQPLTAVVTEEGWIEVGEGKCV